MKKETSHSYTVAKRIGDLQADLASALKRAEEAEQLILSLNGDPDATTDFYIAELKAENAALRQALEDCKKAAVKFTVEIVEMSEAAYENIPEFQGW